MTSKKTLDHYLRELRLIEEHREKNCELKVRKIYKALLKDLQEFLGVEYAQLAEDDKLTYEILHAKGQYARFLQEVEKRLNTFTPEAAKEIRDTVEKTYAASYDGMVKAVEQSKTYAELAESLKGLKAVTPSIISRAVQNPISGLTLKDTLEKNRKEVIYDIKQTIGVGLSQGDRMSTMAKRLTEKVDMDYRKAIRIVRTETHRVREAGYQDSSEMISQQLKDDDSDYVLVKTWKTMKDESVRPQVPAYRRGKGVKPRKKYTAGLRSRVGAPNHVKMEGKMVLVEEDFDLGGGVTAKAPGQSGVAGHDINCRCYLSRTFMTKAEYSALTGKVFEETIDSNTLFDNIQKYRKDINDLQKELRALEEIDKYEALRKLYKEDKEVAKIIKSELKNIQPVGIPSIKYFTNKGERLDFDRVRKKLDIPGVIHHTNKVEYEKFFNKMNELNRRFIKPDVDIDGSMDDIKLRIKAKKDKLKTLEKKLEAFDGNISRTDSAKVLDDLQEYADRQKVFDEQLKEIAKSLNVTEDEARERLSNALSEITNECDIGIRIRSDSLDTVLDNGKFKNLFEIGTSGGCTNQDIRLDGERNVFYFDDNINDKDRPIYGMMVPKLDINNDGKFIDYILNGPGCHYGDGVTVIVKKNKVYHNASFTIGDSLNFSEELNASTFDNPRYNGGHINFKNSISDFLKSSNSASDKLVDTFDDEYLEVQIHGKENHTSDIIEKVYFSSTAADRAKKSGLLVKLDKQGIPYKILNQ